jgi:hypothetical protein
MEKHESSRGELSICTMHSFLVISKSLEGKWSHCGGDGSRVKFSTNHIFMMAHRVNNKGMETVKKRARKGNSVVWIISLSYHLVSSILDWGSELFGKIPLLLVSLWGFIFLGSTV